MTADARPLETLEGAQRVVAYWEAGSASSFETQLIEVFLRADRHNTQKLRRAWPDLYEALRAKGYDALV